jgi:hypothetical protein
MADKIAQPDRFHLVPPALDDLIIDVLPRKVKRGPKIEGKAGSWVPKSWHIYPTRHVSLTTAPSPIQKGPVGKIIQ